LKKPVRYYKTREEIDFFFTLKFLLGFCRTHYIRIFVVVVVVVIVVVIVIVVIVVVVVYCCC